MLRPTVTGRLGSVTPASFPATLRLPLATTLLARANLRGESEPIERDKTMSKPLTVTIPHNLGKDEALRRIQGGLQAARSRFASNLVVREERWTGDHLDFHVAAIAAPQRIAGAGAT